MGPALLGVVVDVAESIVGNVNGVRSSAREVAIPATTTVSVHGKTYVRDEVFVELGTVTSQEVLQELEGWEVDKRVALNDKDGVLAQETTSTPNTINT
jgi:hypothetical protein